MWDDTDVGYLGRDKGPPNFSLCNGERGREDKWQLKKIHLKGIVRVIREKLRLLMLPGP